MRQLKIVGAVLGTVFALSAIASATASAALPEFNPGTAGTKLTGTSGSGTLLTATKGIIECTSDTVSGELTGKKTGKATVTFKGCSAFGFLGAKSLGDAEGVILTKVALELCYINKAKKEVGVLTEVTEPVHVEVAGKLLKITGDAVGKITPVNTKTKKFKLEYKQKGGTQEPAGCEGKTENLKVEENENGKVENAGEATTEESETSVEQTLEA